MKRKTAIAAATTVAAHVAVRPVPVLRVESVVPPVATPTISGTPLVVNVVALARARRKPLGRRKGQGGGVMDKGRDRRKARDWGEAAIRPVEDNLAQLALQCSAATVCHVQRARGVARVADSH